MVVSRLILIRMRNISHEIVEQIKTNFIFNFYSKIAPFMR